jgi:predicted alpha-1,2-mannosidase
LTFDPSNNPLQARIGISFVSAEGAAKNLAAENSSWDFDAVASAAGRAWRDRLGTIEVGGGTRVERRVFYTALYHAFLHPNVFSDADGSALGPDGKIHITSAGRARYENFALWDAYRSEIPLLSILAPIETGDMMASLVAMAEEDPGGGLPRWQQAAGNSGGMVGDGPDVALASAYAFGVRSFDARAALGAMIRGASIPGTRSGGHLVREGLAAYLEKGYVPYSDSKVGRQSASITLEYATADFAVAELAGALGDREAEAIFRRRSRNWRNLWDASGPGFLSPRLDDGTFLPGISATTETGYVEGTAEQYAWMVPFDVAGLVALMGGGGRAERRLDTFFAELNAGIYSSHSFFGNEPGENTPWVYALAGAPEKTRLVVRRILHELFQDSPGGLPGNDDAGALSSWAVFASIGLFPSIPGVGGFVVGSPLFPEVKVHLGGGRVLDIVAPGAATDTAFAQAVFLNHRRLEGVWLPFSAVAEGGRLEFELDRVGGAGDLSRSAR